GRSFSIGLWIGGEGTPNWIKVAKAAIRQFKKKGDRGNPLVITDCPWCRAEIGRCEVPRHGAQLAGISEDARLHCSDASCEYGQEQQSRWLPVEVIDERIYTVFPSIV